MERARFSKNEIREWESRKDTQMHDDVRADKLYIYRLIIWGTPLDNTRGFDCQKVLGTGYHFTPTSHPDKSLEESSNNLIITCICSTRSMDLMPAAARHAGTLQSM